MAVVVSVQVGVPREVRLPGSDDVRRTGIVKNPVAGPVRAVRHNLEGDGQADRKHHGGPYKAIYAYPEEHYPVWSERLGGVDLVRGAFGENLTVRGLLEGEVRIGDLLRIGTAVLRVTEPRIPCETLVFRMRGLLSGEPASFDGAAFKREFLSSGRTGIYLAVAEEGELRAGDDIETVRRGAMDLTPAELMRLRIDADRNPAAVRKALACRDLPPDWADWLRARLEPARRSESGSP